MKKFLKITSLIVLLFSIESNAQGIFLRIGLGGPSIPGESTNSLHLNEIELGSLQEGAGKGCTAGGGGGSCSLTTQSELTVTANLDALSFLKLREAMIKDTPLNIRVSQVTTSNLMTQYDFLQIYMEDAQITGLSVSSGGDRPSISISFNSPKWQHTTKASPMATPVKFGWNFATYLPFSSPN